MQYTFGRKKNECWFQRENFFSLNLFWITFFFLLLKIRKLFFFFFLFILSFLVLNNYLFKKRILFYPKLWLSFGTKRSFPLCLSMEYWIFLKRRTNLSLIFKLKNFFFDIILIVDFHSKLHSFLSIKLHFFVNACTLSGKTCSLRTDFHSNLYYLT